MGSCVCIMGSGAAVVETFRLTGLSLPGVSSSLKGWSAQTPSGAGLKDIPYG